MKGPSVIRYEPPQGRTRPLRRDTRAPRGAGLPLPEGAAGDSRQGATRRVQRVTRGTLTPRLL